MKIFQLCILSNEKHESGSFETAENKKAFRGILDHSRKKDGCFIVCLLSIDERKEISI